MLDEIREPRDELPESDVWERLRALPGESVPDDLLTRCLATIPSSPTARPSRNPTLRFTGLAAAVTFVACATWLLPLGVRGVSASSLIEAAGVTWSEVPACHRTAILRRKGEVRAENVWYVRGKGSRRETRIGDELVGVIVSGDRWEFRWDVRGGIVAAWPSKAGGVRGGFETHGKVLASDAWLKWAAEHRGEVRTEDDVLDGRPVRKAVVRWPAVPGAPPQSDVIWFDPLTLRPVKQRSEFADDSVTEARFDYPAPEDVPADLLTFRIPPGATLEVDDPALGRPLYAEGRPASDAAPKTERGGTRR